MSNPVVSYTILTKMINPPMHVCFNFTFHKSSNPYRVPDDAIANSASSNDTSASRTI